MADLLLGALAAATRFLLMQDVRARQFVVSWRQWTLTILNVFYAVFVAKLILSFLELGMPKGAIVMGSVCFTDIYGNLALYMLLAGFVVTTICAGATSTACTCSRSGRPNVALG
jgi:hypothetical protein